MTLDPNTIMSVLAGFVALEQVLAQCDSIKSNSTFQLICNFTNSVISFFKRPSAP